MPYSDTRQRLINLLKQLGVAALYVLLAKVALEFFSSNGVVSTIWPSSGLALAVLLIGGVRYSWSIFLGAFLANAMTGIALMTAAAIATGNTLEAFIAAWLLARNSRFDKSIHSLHSYLLLILAGSIGSINGALNGATTLLLAGLLTPETYFVNLVQWWMGDMLGITLITPLILVCWQSKNDWQGAGRVAEAVLLLGLAFVAGQIVFLDWGRWFLAGIDLRVEGYVMFLVIMWIVMRLGARGAVVAINMAAIQGLLGAHRGIGYFADDIAQTQLANYWLFMMTLAGIGMALATFISGQKRSEEALRQSEMKFRTLYDSIGDAVHLMDKTGFIDCNKATLAMCGCATKEEFCSKSPVDFSPPEQPCGTSSTILTDRYIATAMGKGSIRFDWVCKRFDNGKLFNIDVHLTIMELDGKPVFLVVARDITERERAKSILAESESRFREIFNAVSDAIFIHDAETGRIIDVNDRMCEMYGLNHESALACDVTDLSAGMPPYSTAEAMEKIHLARTVGMQTFDWLARASDGHLFWVEVSLRFAQIGKRQRILAMVRDITERKATEQHLHELSTHILEVREEEKARIAREIHDELGGTLTALKIDAHWLLRKLPEHDETMELIGRIKSISQRVDHAVGAMRRIIDNMRPAILDDLGLLAAIEWQAAEFSKNTGIECRVACIEDEANLDKQRSIALFRILQEALTNVSRHSGASRVKIEFLHSANQVKLTVSDNGCGIQEKHMAVSKSYGMLGMTERVKQLGGKIMFSNQPEGGFCIEVILPLPAVGRSA